MTEFLLIIYKTDAFTLSVIFCQANSLSFADAAVFFVLFCFVFFKLWLVVFISKH